MKGSMSASQILEYFLHSHFMIRAMIIIILLFLHFFFYVGISFT